MAGAGSENQVVDHDELKQAIKWIESFQVSIEPIVERWSRALLAALEDRDRLRAAAQEVWDSIPSSYESGD